MENNIENNKLIAEFLSVKMHPCKTIENFKFLPMEERGLYNGYFIEDLKYHEDWNWLMEVVEKIEETEIENNILMLESIGNEAKFIYDDGCRFLNSNIGETKIEAVYNACIEFIKWYNEKNQ